MPIGRLDGGRAASAVLGRRPAALLGTLTLLFQAVSAIFNNYSLQLFWGLVVILFQRAQVRQTYAVLPIHVKTFIFLCYP